MSERHYQIIQVRDIEFNSARINRAGITPIYYDNMKKLVFIGLGISKMSGKLTLIGGSYENLDHDLLDTACREYNEEVGKNMANVKPDDLFDSYAIVTDVSIEILMVVDEINFDFEPTDELSGIFWVSINQLKIIVSKSSTSFKYKNINIKAFPLNRYVSDNSRAITSFLKKNIGILLSKSPQSDKIIDRKVKRNDTSSNIVLSSYEQLKKNIKEEYNSWLSTSLVIDETNTCAMICNSVYNTYFFSNEEFHKVIELLCVSQVYIYTHKKYPQLDMYKNKFQKSNILLLRLKKFQDLEREFIKNIKATEENVDIYQKIFDQCKLIIDYEFLLYSQLSKKRKTNNQLSIFKEMNEYIIKNGELKIISNSGIYDLSKKLIFSPNSYIGCTDLKCKGEIDKKMLDILFKYNIFYYNKETCTITIK